MAADPPHGSPVSGEPPESGVGARFRVDYHVHTEFSYDCDTPVEVVLARALEAGIDRLCVTDHGTIAGALRLQGMPSSGIEIIVGCEFDTEDGSQVIGLGLDDVIEESRIPHLLHAIKECGGSVVLPHPFRRGGGIFSASRKRSPGFITEVLELADAVECFNGRDSAANNRRSLTFALQRGIGSVAGSDAHTAAEIGSVFVEYDNSDGVLGASPRRIYYPDQVAGSENIAKRRLMETYHSLEPHLPRVVGSSYRRLRRRVGLDGARTGGTPPRMQHEFARTSLAREDET